MICWRYVLVAVATAMVMALQGVQINMDILVDYMMSCAKPSNWSYNFITPWLFRTEQDGSPTMSHVSRFGMVHAPYFCVYLVISLLIASDLWKKRVTRWKMLLFTLPLLLFTLITPFSIKQGLSYFDRAFQGLPSAALYPIIHDHLAMWTPPSQRGAVCSVVYAGMPLGVALSIWLAVCIPISMDWSYLFYITGPPMALLLLALFLTAATPSLHNFISIEEHDYIEKSLGDGADTNAVRVPLDLQSLLQSKAFWANVTASFCHYWGWYVVLLVLPVYMHEILGTRLANNVLVAVLPFLSMPVFGLMLAVFLDQSVAAFKISATAARKIATLTASVVPLICFLVLGYVGDIPVVSGSVITVAVAAMGGSFSGFMANFIDMGPNYAGVTMGCAAWTIPTAVFLIFIVFHLVLNFKSLTSYRIIFGTTSALYGIEAVIYGIFASAEEQQWDRNA